MQRAPRQYRCHWIDVISRALLVMTDGVVLAAVRSRHVKWTFVVVGWGKTHDAAPEHELAVLRRLHLPGTPA